MAVVERGKKRKSDLKEKTVEKKAKTVSSESEDELDISSDENEQVEDAEGEDVAEKGTKEVDPNKKSSKEQHEEQRKLLKDRKNKRKSGLQVEKIKKLWEKLRVRNPPLNKEVRDKLVSEIWSLCEGLLGDLVLKHDASRVVQTLIKYADRKTRDEICLELKPYYYKLATSAYGKYLLIKLLHYGSKDARAWVIKALHGKLRKLMRHREGAYVVEDMFVLYSTAEQRQMMVREFWGSQYAYFSDGKDGETVTDVCSESAEKRKLIAGNLFGTIKASVEKGSTGFQILHAAMKEYIQIFEGEEVREFIELLAEQIAELVHTPQGCEVACTLIAKATAKERKTILKGLKPHAEAMAKNEHGQMVLQIIFMTVDDTTLVQKTFVSEYKDKLGLFMIDKFSRRPFLYLLDGLNKSYFNPLVLKDIHKYQELSKETSKKPENDRRVQVLKPFLPEFYNIFIENPYELLNVNFGAQFIQDVIFNNDIPEISNELREKALEKVIDCVRGDLTSEEHLINKPYAARFYKALIQGGKWNRETKTVDEVPDIHLGFEFATRFAEELFDFGNDQDKLTEWIKNKDASFVLVALLDQFKANPKDANSKRFISNLKKQAKLIKKQGDDNKGAKVLEGSL